MGCAALRLCASPYLLAVGVVDGTKLRLGEDGVGVLDILKFGRRIGVVAIPIGVHPGCRLPVRALDVLLRCISPAEAKDLVEPKVVDDG